MNTYVEAIMQGENEALAEAERDDLIREAVTACLDVLDEKYPDFKKSGGPFGDKLATDLHRRLEQAFNELLEAEDAELTELARLSGKYRKG